jgi:hypothetical protein
MFITGGTWQKAVCGGGGRENGGYVLKDIHTYTKVY